MDNYFDRGIKMLERELTYLKTAKQKSASSLELITKTVPVSIPLVLGAYQTTAVGRKAFSIIKDDDALIVPYLDWYTENIYNQYLPSYEQGSVRKVRFDYGVYNGSDVIAITATGSRSDIDAMVGGASITVSFNMIIKSTADFNVSAL